MPCNTCGISVVSGWGYIEGFNDWCEHSKAMRRCDSCSTLWWAERMEPDWDVGGCATKDCPECVTASANEEARYAALTPNPCKCECHHDSVGTEDTCEHCENEKEKAS